MLKAGRPSKKIEEKTLSDVMKVKTVRVNFDLEESLHRELKMRAVKEGVSIKELLTQQVKNLLAN